MDQIVSRAQISDRGRKKGNSTLTSDAVAGAYQAL